MNWMRYTALGIGIAFGVLFLTFAIGGGISGDFGDIPDPGHSVLLACGPIPLITAADVAWWHERVGGLWLIVGGTVTGTLFAIRLVDSPIKLFLDIPGLLTANVGGWSAMDTTCNEIRQGGEVRRGSRPLH
jgi:hypothetical protein